MTECNKSVYLENKSIDMIDAVNKGYADGYNKAIDDFVTIIKERVGMDWEWDFYFIGQIAEQLKEGRNNENYNKEES